MEFQVVYHSADFSKLLTWIKTLFTLQAIGEEIDFVNIPPFLLVKYII